MKNTFVSIISACVISAASAAGAAEFVGGTISLSYSGLADSDLNEINKTSLNGRVQVGFSREFSIQAGLGQTWLGLSDFDSTSLDLHGIYHLSESSSVGAFFGRDEIEGYGANFAGLEAGHKVGQFGGEAYIAHAKDGDSSGNLYGIRAAYDLSDYGNIGARFDQIDIEGFDVSRLSLTGEFKPTPGFSLTAEVGSAKFDSLGSEMFVGVGLNVHFGANNGTTFDKRSLLDILPGL
ncbi:hypothetical protein HOY34_01420 [Xinfangfangia sp. D13-10-4-6]|uniref:hypothetical protein n=1 Tax=Pseudogemmobacter hezensis TaxID=2737662 RepID=UPI001553E7CE|nr:hypothetical protein [Pseudogemmobacter hezensis]NPD13857.1 hypothetical protein [Pseudogemmobacter hezensis]